jgi:hypothetical protein
MQTLYTTHRQIGQALAEWALASLATPPRNAKLCHFADEKPLFASGISAQFRAHRELLREISAVWFQRPHAPRVEVSEIR